MLLPAQYKNYYAKWFASCQHAHLNFVRGCSCSREYPSSGACAYAPKTKTNPSRTRKDVISATGCSTRRSLKLRMCSHLHDANIMGFRIALAKERPSNHDDTKAQHPPAVSKPKQTHHEIKNTKNTNTSRYSFINRTCLCIHWAADIFWRSLSNCLGAAVNGTPLSMRRASLK